MKKRLYKNKKEAQIDGICAGIAEYINIDVVIVRLIFLIWAFSGSGILVYLVASLIIPYKPDENEDENISE